MVRCGRVRRTASASSPAQGGRRCLGGSVPESGAGAELGSEARRRVSLPSPVVPSARRFTRLGSRFPPEIGDISRSPPAHPGHPHSAPQKQLLIIRSRSLQPASIILNTIDLLPEPAGFRICSQGFTAAAGIALKDAGDRRPAFHAAADCPGPA